MEKPMSELEEDELFNTFLRQLELEQNIGRHAAFVQNYQTLNSSTSFSQYNFNNIRLITMIGELHEQVWDCPQPHTSISEYCKQSVERNPNCKIMLEYNGGDNPMTIGSQAVRDTYSILTRIGRQDAIIPWDYRAFFLTPEGQDSLYGNYNRYLQSWEDVFAWFIKPFFDKQRNDPYLFALNPQEYNPNIINYMITYRQEIETKFRSISELINSHQPNIAGRVHLELKEVWGNVADWYILRNLLRNDNIDEYILIVGQAHYTNLRKRLTETANLLNEQSNKNRLDCVQLFQTIRF